MKKTSKITGTWLSLSEAANLLGVHFTTLRRWSDERKIPCVRTPGGQRRFNSEDLERFLEGHQNLPLDNTLPVKEKHFIDLARHRLQTSTPGSEPWMVQFDADQRLQFRQTGNRIAAILKQYIDNENDKDALLEEGKRIAEDYGMTCYQTGLSIDLTIQAFLFFKRSFFTYLYETRYLEKVNEVRSTQVHQNASLFFDEMLVSLVHRYFLLASTQRSNSDIT